MLQIYLSIFKMKMKILKLTTELSGHNKFIKIKHILY